MRIRGRSAALCVIASISMAVIVAGAVHAEAPEFGRCIKQAGGRFENPTCTKEATEAIKHKFEWQPGVIGTKFSTKMTSELAAFEKVNFGGRLPCTGEASTGEYTGAKTVGNLVMKFTGCEMRRGIPCNSKGKGPGEIDSVPLQGELGVVKLGTNPPVNNKLGLVLFGPEHGPLVEFACSTILVTVQGSFIHPIATNKMVLTATEKYAAAKGEQRPDKFVGEGVDAHTLVFEEGVPPDEGALILEQTLANEEPVEASSVN